MDNSKAQADALGDLNMARFYMALGFVLVHIAAFGLFTGVLPEAHAVLGIGGLACYRSGNRQAVKARKLLLASLNANRLIA